MKRIWMLILLLPMIEAVAQPGVSDSRSQKMQAWGYFCKFSAIVSLGGGTHLSASLGVWKNTFDLQPSLNTSFNWTLGYNNFGSRMAQNQRTKGTIIFSPLLLVRCGGATSRVAEVNPFYFGYSSGVLSDYQNYVALGTSFVAAPKGLDKNIMTARNRSQQLLFVGFKIGWDSSYIMFNMYEDYFLGTNNLLQALADNRDRFFTGGGNLQLCINHYYTIKYYTETYTGNSYIDHIQYPDIVYPYDTIGSKTGFGRIFSGPRRYRRYAYQDPGQTAFNQGRDILVFEYSGKLGNQFHQQDISKYHHTGKAMVMIGRQGFRGNMWQQNLIHNFISVDKPTGLGPKEEGERYHRFKPRSENLSSDADRDGNKSDYKPRKIIVGFGYNYGIQ